MGSTCFRLALKKLRIIPFARKHVNLQWRASLASRNIHRGLTIAAIGLSLSSNQHEDVPKQPKLEVSDLETWNLDVLLRNSSTASVEASSALLTYATIGLTNLEQDCTRATYTLIKLMEVKLEVLGKPEEEKIEDLILETRNTIEKLERKRKDMEMLFHTSQRLLMAAAEASYLAGSEYGSVAANEKLNSSSIYIKSYQQNRMAAETELRELQARTVEAETRHAEENERQDSEKQNDETQLTSDDTGTRSSDTNT